MVKKALKGSTFFRYNLVALTATAVDFTLLIFFTEVLHFWYLVSSVIASTIGGCVAFVLERNWTFNKKGTRIPRQVFRYILTWCGSIGLNTFFLFVFVDYFHIQYIVSRVIVAVSVGMLFNYFTHKYFIFR